MPIRLGEGGPPPSSWAGANFKICRALARSAIGDQGPARNPSYLRQEFCPGISPCARSKRCPPNITRPGFPLPCLPALAINEPNPGNLSRMSELVFEVTQEEDGGFCAECLSENIFTQGRHLGSGAPERPGGGARVLF